MLNGWIKIHRKILDHWVSQEPELLAVWIRLLTEANHADTKKMFNGSLVTIARGQLIFGLDAFSVKSGVSLSKLRRYMKLLESDGMINRQKTSKYSIITITCFDDYQASDRQNTGKAQAGDRQSASKRQYRENVKNEKNVENYISPNGDSSLPSNQPDNCPHEEIVSIYHELLHECPRVKVWNTKRKAKLRARWREDKKRQDIDWWRRYFTYVRDSDFLMGKVESRDRSPFMADLEFLVTESKMINVLEGKYHAGQ